MSYPKTLLVGWDGADWDIARPLMEAGQMPCLASLVQRGTSGDLISYAPYLSPMLWTTIATGHDPDRHGVHGFAEVDPLTGEARAVGSVSRKTKALWNIVSEQGGSVGVAGWMGSFPAEAVHGAFVADAFAHPPTHPQTPWPVAPGSVYPPVLAAELEDLRLRPEDVDPGLLGLFVPELREKGLIADPALARLMQRLAQLYTVQNAAVAIAGRGQPDFMAVYFHFLDLICHDFVMYHPPRHPRVGMADYRRYQAVVGAAYRVQDALLGDLLRHCSPDTRVILVSDHGFTTGAARPEHTSISDAGPAAWHRKEGLVVACGPGVVKGGRFAGVRPQDIAPMVLAWMGLPRGGDMTGRVPEEMFTVQPVVATVPSWDAQPARVEPPAVAAVETEADELRRLTHRFIQLGYLDPAVQKGRTGGEWVEDENRAILGIALRDLGRPEDALPLLQAAALAEPESAKRAVEFGLCLLDLGLATEAERALRTFFDHGEGSLRALLLQAQLLIGRRRFPEAFKVIERLDELDASGPGGGLRRLALLLSGRYGEAREAFKVQIAKTPGRVTPYIGLGHACLWSGRLDEAVMAVHRAEVLDRGSPLVKVLREQVLACKESGKGEPALPGWDELAQQARRRAVLRAEIQERETAFVEAREARRSVKARSTVGATVDRAPILVVSGAPRSGTSMMMRMLALAGVPVLTDGVRPADADNQLGYFEWEPVKRLAMQPESISRAEGKAVKVISGLLRDLPQGRRYEVIFMRRGSRDILDSQEGMIARGGGEAVRLTVDELDRHVGETLAWARIQPNIRLLELSYDELLERPEAGVAQLAAFVGPDRIKRQGGMRIAIRADLRHQKTASSHFGA